MLAAATVAPGFWDWSFDPPLVLVIDLAILYWLGDRRTVTPARTRASAAGSSASLLRGAGGAGDRAELAAGDPLRAAVLGAHGPARAAAGRGAAADRARAPVDAPVALAAAGCCAAGWRATSARAERTRWLRAASRALGSPQAGFVRVQRRAARLARAGAVRRDAALRRRCTRSSTRCSSPPRVMFWKQVIDSPPLHARAGVGAARRRTWSARWSSAGCSRSCWRWRRIRCTRSTRTRPSRPGGISALADQQLAAGHHVGARLDHVRDRHLRLRPPLARAARARSPPRTARLASEPLGGAMSSCSPSRSPRTSSRARSSRWRCRWAC